MADPSRFGVVPTDASGRVTAFLEKTPNTSMTADPPWAGPAFLDAPASG